MFKVGFYLYDETKENCKGIDLSKYVAIGSAINETLDGTIDTYGITLNGLPFRDEIEPSTKFIYELIEDDSIVKTIDMVLQSDAVEQPILSDDTYFIHNLELANPAIIAQQKICDNMSFTYKLKDVDLSKSSSLPDDNVSVSSGGISINYNDIIMDKYNDEFTKWVWEGNSFTANYQRWQAYIHYGFEWVQPTLVKDDTKQYVISEYKTDISTFDVANLKANVVLGEGVSSKTISFFPPMLRIKVGKYSTTETETLGIASVYLTLQRTNIASGGVEYYDNANAVWNTSETKNLISPYTNFGEDIPSPENALSLAEWLYYSANQTYTKISNSQTKGYLLIGIKEITTSSSLVSSIKNDWQCVEVGYPKIHGAFTTLSSLISANRYISFTAEVGYFYNIYITPIFDSFTYASRDINYQTVKTSKSLSQFKSLTTTSQNLKMTLGEINIYQKATSSQIITKASTIPTCYEMLKKSVLSTYNAKRGSETNAFDTETFITLGNYERDLLKNTSIVENVVQEKNLWEVITMIGDYVHAKPYLTFDRDNKKGALSLKFKEYGSDTQVDNLGVNETIYNSKFIEEYISSLDSYCDNLMQLNSTITEVLFMTSESDDYLVYNDNVCLKTKYPIMEIVKLEILKQTDNTFTDSDFKDITNYVYEYNVWKCLGIDTSVVPSRANSIYYHLYSNKIEGMQYLIPTINKTAQYPIKEIVADIYGGSSTDEITVSDYTFRITYRTKDKIRVRNVRPDLRKYLYNNDYEYLPLHQQFRNQTDKIVDSEKLGNNIYGELIRTGNTIFETTKWCNDTSELNRVGDFVKLQDNQMYYISKINTNIYTDHIESKIEYSKDFNRLSQIIGIPSEPRFYEISEQNNITRDVVINQTICIYTEGTTIDTSNNVFDVEPSYLYVMLVSDFKVDRAKITYKDNNSSFPTDDGYSKTCSICAPILWSIQNTTLTFSCDMEDNFMCGNTLEYIDNAVLYAPSFFTLLDYIVNNNKNEQSYKSLAPIRYTDIYGRCEYVNIELGSLTLSGTTHTVCDAIRINQKLLESFGNTRAQTTTDLVLNKDNREALSFNICLSAITDSDRLIVSSMFWHMGDYYKDLSLVVFNDREINKQKYTITSTDYIVIDDNTCLSYDSTSDTISISLAKLTETYKDYKAYALCKKVDEGSFIYFIGKNISNDFENAQKSLKIATGRFEGRTNTTQLNKLLK